MRRAPIIVLSGLVLLLTAAGAAAEDQGTPLPEKSRRRSVEILAHMDKPRAHESWLRHHLARIHLHDDTGLAYTQPVRLAERDLEFSVRGPALDTKSVGLSFEIRF